ncbi:MAG: Tryptophanase 1 [Candidatus Heimdallarchaeota archaeon LC_2]|nr:MAG: Tryptophanase 1 [Candidatus Heimdallarchaeota archaeon LC_2]
MMVSYPPPPYRIKMIEPIELPSVEQRIKSLEAANFNLFNLKAEDIFIDLLTDSGTGAMSQNQWADMMRGDESYANAKSFIRFRDTIQKITGFKEILPTHQGRAAENILFGHILREAPNSVVISNQSFDTTIGHMLYNDAKPIDLVSDIAKDASNLDPFKGNMDIEKLNKWFKENDDHIAAITLVITNNAGGGQPVSMANIKEVSNIAKDQGIPFFLDIARFIENSYFIQQREEGYKHKTLTEIALETTSYSDGAWMSAKKDAFVNIGGFLALRDSKFANILRERLILFEGFPSYGGLAGRDLEAIATGLEEALTTSAVKHRINQIEYLVNSLNEEGIPVMLPAGGHAAFIDAKAFLPHIPSHLFPAQALSCEIYLEGGIRTVEIGSLMFGKEEDGEFIPAQMELVRLTIPRRTYEKAHFDYIIEILKKIKSRKDKITGLQIIDEPEILRHFSCKLAPAKIIEV